MQWELGLKDMPKVAVGGTFQYLYDGHVELIKKAFEVAKDGKVI
jgi:pantetheine-phosphate adenylyltransferase